MEAVDSSNVKAIGYDPEISTLRVEYLSGGTYDYPGVGASEHRALMAAESKGSHLHAHIKSNHEAKKLP